MFQLAEGVSVPDPARLREQYVQEGDTLTLNLSFEKLPVFLADGIRMLEEPLFLAIHPDTESAETWYLDNMTHAQLETVLDGFGELLYQDGMSAFAIGSLQTDEEIFVQKYKIISLYSPKIARFLPLLTRYGVSATTRLVTAWDTFTEATPGEARRLEIAGMTVPDLIDELCKIGMYKAEQ